KEGSLQSLRKPFNGVSICGGSGGFGRNRLQLDYCSILMLMGNDFQNKKRSAAERAASLRRRGSVPDTERKLSEARRLFSLRDFVACDALLLQVLEADPLNSQAKALNELTAIKLRKRKLYSKLVDPRSPRKSQPSSISSQIAEPLAAPNVSSEVHSPLTPAKG